MDRDDELLARLDELEAASRERKAELLDLARSVPDAVSRRALVQSLATDVRSMPEIGTLGKAVALRVAYRPARMWREFRQRRAET